MSDFVERCRGLIDNRGIFGFVRFVLKSVVRHTRDIVFEIYSRDFTPVYQKPLSSNLAVHVIDSRNVTQPQLSWVLDQALAGENSIYREGLSKQNLLIAVTKGEMLVHYSFVQFDTSYKIVLNEPFDAPLIGNCWTSPECRGQGIYPYVITKCLEVMASRGCERVLISCAPDNFASIAGIEKAGFERVRSVNTFVFVTKFMLQKLESKKSSRYRFAVL